jgi:hypothetical protein
MAVNKQDLNHDFIRDLSGILAHEHAPHLQQACMVQESA